MKTIILTAAALALTATAASAGSAIPLNSDGERKYDYASRLQAERGEGQVEFGAGVGGGLDFTATRSISSAPAASDRVSIRRIDDRNDGTIVEFSRINEQGKREVFRTVHFPS